MNNQTIQTTEGKTNFIIKQIKKVNNILSKKETDRNSFLKNELVNHRNNLIQTIFNNDNRLQSLIFDLNNNNISISTIVYYINIDYGYDFFNSNDIQKIIKNNSVEPKK
jgi:hypothetical protein